MCQLIKLLLYIIKIGYGEKFPGKSPRIYCAIPQRMCDPAQEEEEVILRLMRDSR